MNSDDSIYSFNKNLSIFRWLVYCQVLGDAERGATNVSLPKIGLVKITFDMTQMTHVTRLSLRHNSLGLIPNEIASMQMLAELHLQYNRLTQLTNVMIGLTNLSTVAHRSSPQRQPTL